jgi:glucokinase
MARAFKDIINKSIYKILWKYISIPEWFKIGNKIRKLKKDFRTNRKKYQALFNVINEKIKQNRITEISPRIGDYGRGELELVDRTLDLFFEMYGRAARDTIMAQGAKVLLLAGGIPGKYIGFDHIGNQRPNHDHYLDLFICGLDYNPVQKENTDKVPIYQLTNPDIGLIGCTIAAQELLEYQ